MNYPELLGKRGLYQSGRASIPGPTLQSCEQAPETGYTHNSTAIERNTLTPMEVKMFLEGGITIGRKGLREIYETANHQKAYRYVKEYTAKEQPLDGKIIKDIHALLARNIFVRGVYRDVDVYVSEAQHTPPSPGKMYRQVKDFYVDPTRKGKEMNPIKLAARAHAESVRVHPFLSGDGRTSCLIMNYQFLVNGFPVASITKENRLDYFNAPKVYTVEDNLVPFAEMAADLTDQQLGLHLDMMEPSQNTQRNPKV